MTEASAPVQLFVSIAFYIIAGPVLLSIILFNEIVRLIVSLALYLKYEGKVFLVGDGNDGIWATQSDHRSRMIVLGGRFKGKLKEESILDLYNNTIRFDKDEFGDFLNDKFERFITTRMGYACWERDLNFDIKNHVRFLSSGIYDKPKLQKLIQELSLEMAGGKPQWEFIIVPRYKSEQDETESGWVFCRFNHGYADGISTLMFLKRYIFSNFTYFIDPFKLNVPFKLKFLYYLNAILFGPWAGFSFLKTKSGEFWPRIDNNNKYRSRNFRWTEGIDLDNIKLIRKAAGNTTTSAVIENAFISAAMQVLPPNRLPTEWVIGEMAAMLPYPDEKLRNHFSAFKYSINSHQDEWTRLKESKEAAWEAIMGPSILLFYTVFKIMGRMPVIFHPILLDGTASSLVFSNVPGSRTKVVGLDDVEVSEFLGFPPQANGTGVTLFCSAYENNVKVCSVANTNWLSEEELDEIIKRLSKIIEGWTELAKNKDKIG